MTERNNFDLLRLALASTVFLVHAHILSRAPALAFLERFLSTDFAVKGFFAVSGYLVFMSFERSASLREYFEKRARRILPAYAFVVLAAFLAGAALTDRDLQRYLFEGALRYLAANLAFANFLAPALPGVFESNPQPTVNGALWTLKIEVMFYLTVPLIAALFRFGRVRVILTLYVLSVAYTLLLTLAAERTGLPLYTVLARQYPGQLAFFLCGALMYYAAPPLQRVPYVAAFVAACAYLIAAGTAEPLLGPVAISYTVLYFALAFPYLGNFGRFGDFSYGVYILHFPILQLLVQQQLFARDPMFGFAVACASVYVCAAVLWHLVEKRFLRGSSHYRRAAAAAAEGR